MAVAACVGSGWAVTASVGATIGVGVDVRGQAANRLATSRMMTRLRGRVGLRMMAVLLQLF
jgi:hypothetical protein